MTIADVAIECGGCGSDEGWGTTAISDSEEISQNAAKSKNGEIGDLP